MANIKPVYVNEDGSGLREARDSDSVNSPLKTQTRTSSQLQSLSPTDGQFYYDTDEDRGVLGSIKRYLVGLRDTGKKVNTISDLRNESIGFFETLFSATPIRYVLDVDGNGQYGIYEYDSSDSSTSDDGKNVIVDGDGNRWKLRNVINRDLTWVNVKRLGIDGSSASADTSALNNYISNNNPTTLFFPKGSYTFENISLENGWKFVGEGYSQTVINLTSGATNPLFNYKGTGLIKDFNIEGMELRGDGTSGPDAIDISSASSCEYFVIRDNYINNFRRGYSGSENDRAGHIYGNRIWNNDTGIYIQNNHPNIGFNDIRNNRIGLGGSTVYDLECTQTKFVRNDYGVYAENGEVRQSSFTNCIFFGNATRHAIIDSRVTISSCNIATADQTHTIGIEINGDNNNIVGNKFMAEAGTYDYSDAAIVITGNRDFFSNNISENVIKDINDFVRIDGSLKLNRGLKVNNNVAQGLQSLYFSSGSIDNGDQICSISGNVIVLGGHTSNVDVILIGKSLSSVGQRICGNSIQSLEDTMDGYAVTGNLDGAIVKNNIIRRTQGINTSTSTGAIISDNNYTA